MKKLMFTLLLMFLSHSPKAQSSFGNWKAVEANRQGVSSFREQDQAKAQEKFTEALAEAPYAPELQLNLGLSFQMTGQAEKAQAAYESIVKHSDDKKLNFVTNFNLGTLAQKAQKVDEALSFYQKALDFNPESRETKVNIELLIKQQQQGGQGGQGDSKDKKDNQDQNKDQNQDKKDQDKDKDKEKDQDKQKKEYAKNKPQPKPFKSEQLSQSDVNKILGELKQQEQRIRADYNKREVKEKPKDKDW